MRSQNLCLAMRLRLSFLAVLVIGFPPFTADAQSTATLHDDTPQTRMRPLGAPSAVDRYTRRTDPPGRNSAWGSSSTTTGTTAPTASTSAVPRNETVHWKTGSTSAVGDPNVRQAVWMQSQMQPPPTGPGGAMELPGNQPPANDSAPITPPALPNSQPFPNADGTASSPPSTPQMPPATPPRSLPSPGPSNGSSPTPSTITSPSDMTPIPQPQLGASGFATIDNCRLITGPSTYTAAMGNGCGQTIAPVGYCGPPPVTTTTTTTSPLAGVPAEIAPPVGMPPPSAVTTAPPPSAVATTPPPRPLISFGQANYPVQVGQGLWGQPVAYVPGQYCRNWIRYLFP